MQINIIFRYKIAWKGVSCKPDWTILVSRQARRCRCAYFWVKGVLTMATGKSCSRWFAPVVALLMVFSLSGCFDKEGDQRKAFVDFLQNTAMCGERLPTLTADQKNSLVRSCLITRYCMATRSR